MCLDGRFFIKIGARVVDKFEIKTKVYVDHDADQILTEIKGQKVWIGCDPFLRKTPVFQKILHDLETQNEVEVFSDIVPEPPIAKISVGIESYLKADPTQVIAVGGGSAIDTVKAVRYFAKQKYPDLKTNTLIAIPTTSGTGSEVTSISVITDPDQHVKYPLEDQALVPDIALLKQELVESCPPSVTAYSGMDVLTHCLEALVARNANYFSDALAEKGIRMVFESLLDCQAQTECADYHKMQEASCIAGCAFQTAGLGVSHAIAHQIGSVFHIPHGLANSILLPAVVRFNAQDQKSALKYRDAAVQLQLCSADTDPKQAVELLVAQIKKLSCALTCPQTLSEFGVKKDELAAQLGQLVEHAQADFTFAGNPIEASKKDIISILLSVF